MTQTKTEHELILAQIISQIISMLREQLELLRVPFKIPAINIKMGEFQTPYHQNEGMQWSNTREFELDDSFGNIAPRSIAMMTSPATSIMFKHIHVNQWAKFAQQDLIFIIDASRSILSGCFAEPDQVTDKLKSYCHAINQLVNLAQHKRFTLRIFIARNHQTLEIVSEDNAIDKIIMYLKQQWQHSLQSYLYDEKERFCLHQALTRVTSLQNRSLVVVLSDFIEPIEQYNISLQRLLKKHHCILFDVASKQDRAYPLPKRIIHYHYENLPLWDGARYLESSSAIPCKNVRKHILLWNKQQQRNYTALQQQINKNGAHIYALYGLSKQQCFDTICRALKEVN